ncbi:MAG: hypothetical protein KDI63_00430 [Gammaproteobacteria bacterium]|nr:hypothetical protein [Gammaproteobacteria bacterium]
MHPERDELGIEREIRRYSAYYRGWCLAFGEHDPAFSDDESINWVFGADQMGFIASHDLKKMLHKVLLGRQEKHPSVTLTETHVDLGEINYPFSPMQLEGARRFREFIRQHDSLNLYLTSHFWYPPGSRIITFSPRRPAVILYKEIAPLRLKLI